MTHPGSLLKCRFVTSGSEVLYFYKLSVTVLLLVMEPRFKEQGSGSVVLHQRHLAPQGTLGNLWRHFFAVTTGILLLASPV